MTLRILLPALAASLLWPVLAHAQPFFGNATAYTPETATFTSGVTMNMQATVSADRKYVTITARPSLQTLLSMQTVTFGPQSNLLPPTFVGGQAPVAGGGAGGGANPARLTPAAQQSGLEGTILGRQGMTRLAGVA